MPALKFVCLPSPCVCLYLCPYEGAKTEETIGNENLANECVANKLPTSASGSASPTGTDASKSGSASGSAATTGAASPSGSGTGSTEKSPSGTSSGGPAQNTGAAGTLEISAAALLAGLGVVVAAL